MTPIRLLLADDQRVVRDGLAMLLGTIDDIEVVGTAADGAEAIALVEQHAPDVVLMDLKMPGTDGVAATQAISGGTAVLILTTYADDESILPALQAGARGYLTKDASAEEIEAAIHAVHAGRTHLDPAVQARLVEISLQATPAPTAATAPHEDLTARETEVLALIAAGLSNHEIAAKLVVSHATVKTHVNRIFMKTGSRDRAQAVRYAYANGLATE